MLPVEGHKNLYRDEESNAIVSTDDSAYQDYMNTRRMNADKKAAVSYTHLTLPTILRV